MRSKPPCLIGVIPVKSFAMAKQRLASLLQPQERAALARAMFEDVLDVVAGSPYLAGTLVVTNDPQAAAIARHGNARVLTEPADGGLVPAMRYAAGFLCDTGNAGMVVIPADLPMIKAADIELIVRSQPDTPAVALVGASSDGGTNALLCSPPNAIPICFGRDSFRVHRNMAQALGLLPKVLTVPRLARDIDRPEDLLAFMEQPCGPRTHAYLSSSGIAQRLYTLRAHRRAAKHEPLPCPELISDESAAIYQKG